MNIFQFFDGTSGKLLKDSGISTSYLINGSVRNDRSQNPSAEQAGFARANMDALDITKEELDALWLCGQE